MLPGRSSLHSPEGLTGSIGNIPDDDARADGMWCPAAPMRTPRLRAVPLLHVLPTQPGSLLLAVCMRQVDQLMRAAHHTAPGPVCLLPLSLVLHEPRSRR